jgi:hypothetical protein
MNTNDIIAACREFEKMETIMNNNIAVCRETQNRRFIRDPKSHKNQLKMTRDNKSHKKVHREKISKAISKKQAVKEKEVPCEYSVPEPKPKPKPKKSFGKVKSNENLLACLEDIECAEEDAEFDRLQVDYDYIMDMSWEDEYRYIKDTCLPLSEYEIECEQERQRWAFCESHGMTRKMFCETLEYEKNVKALEDELDPENIQELIFKIWIYEQNLDKWVQDETSKMDNWFDNFAENNPDFVQKIQERNYCLQETIIQAIMG